MNTYLKYCLLGFFAGVGLLLEAQSDTTIVISKDYRCTARISRGHQAEYDVLTDFVLDTSRGENEVEQYRVQLDSFRVRERIRHF